MTMLHHIGDTRLVPLRHIAPEGSAAIFLKLEYENPTGSMKDRMALAMVEAAEADGRLRPGGSVVEYTGGSTGVSLAFVCAAKRIPLHIVTSEAFSREKRDHMAALGARLTLVPSATGGTTKALTLEMIETARRIAASLPGSYWTDQLNNADVLPAYGKMGDEIWSQTGGKVDAFVQSVGTCGSLRGVASRLRALYSSVHVVAVEPAESAVLSGGRSGSHKIEGTGAGFVVPLWKPGVADEIQAVPTEEAMATARRLAREESLFAGTSTGANVAAALRVAKRLGRGKTVVTVAVDSGMKYLSTALYAGTLALALLVSAAGAAQAQDAPDAAADAYGRGKAHAAKYEWDAAIAAFEEAARLFVEAGEQDRAASAFHGAGYAHYVRGDYEKTLEQWEKVLTARIATGEREHEAGALGNIGIVHWVSGDYEKALLFHGRGLAIAEDLGDKGRVGTALNNIGLVHWSMGNYAQSLAFHRRSLKIAEELDDEVGKARSYTNIGNVCVHMGDYGHALKFYQKGLFINEERKDPYALAQSLGNIGVAHKGLGDYGQAVSFYERSLVVSTEMGDKIGEARSLGNIANILWATGDHAGAREYYEKSVGIMKAAGNREGEATVLSNLCDVRYDALETVLSYGARALAIAKEIDSPETMFVAHAALGTVFAEAAKKGAESTEGAEGASAFSARPAPSALALQHFRSAVEIAESLRFSIADSEQKSTFLETKLGVYEGIVELLIADFGLRNEESPSLNPQSTIPNPQSEEAFGIAEKMKARSFLDELGAAKFSRAGVPEALLQEKRLLEARIKWLRERQ